MRSLRSIDFVRVFLFAFVFAALACAVPGPGAAAVDAFYTPPPDITKYAPGDIIRTEPVSPAPSGARAWKIL